LLDTLPSKITEAVDVLLPGATWAEKSGSFENVNGRQQHFDAALPVIELAKPEGQIALDLMSVMGKLDRQRYDPTKWRTEMGDTFATDMHHPAAADQKVADVQYVQL
ncbi:MAG: molybdopterin-dependent oxidoreductase, partial [Planctomycetota bacterium]